ncbi:hypothetical protein DPMN_115727 [Dreissena polymorpha]|uniref:Uncharacterized protein n=1 Tax=Dreissena polymorpha TaxID=45954 RepID=A0A9D4KND1_DREPO|nr:hypothetical protein DPMN_115727 [Dreissena polymorpha]
MSSNSDTTELPLSPSNIVGAAIPNSINEQSNNPDNSGSTNTNLNSAEHFLCQERATVKIDHPSTLKTPAL